MRPEKKLYKISLRAAETREWSHSMSGEKMRYGQMQRAAAWAQKNVIWKFIYFAATAAAPVVVVALAVVLCRKQNFLHNSAHNFS